MAAVDTFDLLLREILRTTSNFRDTFAILGALYTTRKALRLTGCFLRAVNDHFVSKLLYSTDLRRKFGPWAVLTGSSDGIGRAYAEELAVRGLNLVLISRGAEKLYTAAREIVVTGSSEGIGRAYAQELASFRVNVILISLDEPRLYEAAKKIEEQFGVETCAVAVDFAEGRGVYDTIWEAIQDKEIGILVNNVGVMYDHPQLFLDVPRERLWQIINVNVAAATMMTHMILPQMVKRKKGAVVMVSSGACSQITPQMTVYAGTKSFLDYFARALSYEYKDKGIFVQSLQPFYVATRMTRYSETLQSHGFLIPSAAVYARHAVKTLGVSKRTSGYWPHTIQRWLSDLIPEWLWMWGAMRLNNALRRQASQRLKKKAQIKSPSSEEH